MSQENWARLVAAIALAGAVATDASCTREPRQDPAEHVAFVSAPLNASPHIRDFVLYAQRSVSLAGSDTVAYGDVGVRATAPSSFGAQLVVGPSAQVFGNSLAPSVSLAAGSSIADVQTGSLQNKGGSHGTLAAFPASAMPALPLAVPAGAAGSNVTVASGHTTTLAPGNYGTLAVSGTVHLKPGVFSFSSVSVGTQGQLLADLGAVDLRVAGQLSSGWGSLVQGPTADQLTISVSGADGVGGTPPAASIGSGSQVTALVSVPNGTLSVGDQAVATGAFAAFDLRIGQSCNVSYQAGFSASAPGQHGLVERVEAFAHDHMTGRAGADAAAGVIDVDVAGERDVENAARKSGRARRHVGGIDLDDFSLGLSFDPVLDRVLLLRPVGLRGFDVGIRSAHEWLDNTNIRAIQIFFFVGQERVTVPVFLVRLVLLAIDEPPLVLVEGRKPGVAPLDREVELGEVKPVGDRQRLREKLAAADDENLVVGAGGHQRLIEAVRDEAARGRCVSSVPRDYDGRSAGQWLADRLERLASHDQVMTHRQLFEPLEVGRQMPGQFVVDTDDSIAVHRDDERDHARPQTATGALMCGCVW